MPALNIIPTFYPCRGMLLERTPRDIEFGTFPVSIYDGPRGSIAKLLTKLGSVPGLEDNFVKGTHVIVMVCYTYEVETGRWLDVVNEAFHYIAGSYDPGSLKRIPNPNPNADLEGVDTKFVGPKTGCGVVIEKSGAVRIVTSGRVINEYTPDGDGIFEDMNRQTAQNFHRIIAGNPPDYQSREHFGLYAGGDLNEKITKSTDLKDVYMVYRRFIQQSRDPDAWVSTCEGAFCPWVGSNNGATQVEKNSEIIFNKIINHGTNRITIKAGEAGPEFLSFRVDEINPRPANGEIFQADSAQMSPVIAFAKAVFNISEQGELYAEFGVTKAKQVGMSLKITKDGEVDIKVGKSFKINGKQVLTDEFLNFFKKHQQDLVQVTAIGAPAPMSPAAVPDFTAGQKPGNFFADKATNDLTSTDTGLVST